MDIVKTAKDVVEMVGAVKRAAEHLKQAELVGQVAELMMNVALVQTQAAALMTENQRLREQLAADSEWGAIRKRLVTAAQIAENLAWRRRWVSTPRSRRAWRAHERLQAREVLVLQLPAPREAVQRLQRA